MTKQIWLVIALLVAITVLAVSYFAFGILVFDVEVIALALAVALKTILSGGKIVILFFRQTLFKTIGALFSKRVLRPLYGILGVTYVSKRASNRVKKHMGPKFANFKSAAKERWINLPVLVRALIVGASVAAVCVMGYGLWLIPLGMSFYVFIASRVQTVWFDLVIRKKTKHVTRRAHAHMRKRKKHRFVMAFRKTRLVFLKWERRVVARIRSCISV